MLSLSQIKYIKIRKHVKNISSIIDTVNLTDVGQTPSPQNRTHVLFPNACRTGTEQASTKKSDVSPKRKVDHSI